MIPIKQPVRIPFPLQGPQASQLPPPINILQGFIPVRVGDVHLQSAQTARARDSSPGLVGKCVDGGFESEVVGVGVVVKPGQGGGLVSWVKYGYGGGLSRGFSGGNSGVLGNGMRRTNVRLCLDADMLFPRL